MDYVHFKNKWEKLLFLPLSLEIEPLNLDLFRAWMELSKESDLELYLYSMQKLGREPATREQIEYQFNKKNFWKSYYAISKKSIAEGNRWIANFDNMFPQLASFVDSLPITRISSVGFLVQNQQPETYPQSYLHVDGREIFGFRIFFNAKPDGFFMHAVKEDALNSERMVNLDGDPNNSFHIVDENRNPIIDEKTGKFKINEKMIHAEEIRPRILNNAFPFVLNNHLAGHAAVEDPGSGGNTKITMIVLTEGDHKTAYDFQRFDELLTDSLTKYQDYAVWHPGK